MRYPSFLRASWMSVLPTLIKVKESMPRLRPVAMLKVSGVATRVRKAGNASLKSSQRSHMTTGTF
jgi:hypothetical protein